MRVLLPLKKKQDDPSSHEQQYVDESETLATGEAHAGTAEGQANAAIVEEAWTEVPPHEATSPTAVLLSAAAARLSCLPQSTIFCSKESSSSVHSPTVSAVDAVEEKLGAGLSILPKRPSNSPHSTRNIEATLPKAIIPESTEAAFEGKETADSVLPTFTDTASLQDSTYRLESSTGAPLPSVDLALPAAGATTSSVASLSTSSSSPTATPSTPTPSTITSVTPGRKRQSSSPSSLDLKPPSKKLRDTKQPAIDTTDQGADIKMAGGRGGRKVWSSPPSYCVETTNGGGREEVSNREEGAEVDVRFTYRHENDPSSARGDAPTLTLTPNANSNSGKAPNANCNQHASLQDVCGRDDLAEERESCVERPFVADDDLQFAVALKKQGLEIVEQEGDGNCLFRGISLQVYGDASMHREVRHQCLDFMARDKEHFSQFITDEPFEQYIRRKRQDGVHGNNPEIQAISELFNRPIEVFVPENGASPLNIFHAEYKTQDAPIRLSYHDGNHYNAVIDPLVPTAGLGLGLPGLQPGLADKMQVAKAVAESDRLADQREYERALEESHHDQLQRAIKESTLSVDNLYQNKALSLSDCDATNFELEQAVLESSMESFRTFEHGRKQASKANSANGRRKRQASPPRKSNVAAGAVAASSSVASIPREARQDAGLIPNAAAASAACASPSVASAPTVASRPVYDDYRSSQADGAHPMIAEQYPQTVQELVMNGFELRRVVHAYELIGDNFDDLLGFLMSNGGS